jgi:hypothetical protein
VEARVGGFLAWCDKLGFDPCERGFRGFPDALPEAALRAAWQCGWEGNEKSADPEGGDEPPVPTPEEVLECNGEDLLRALYDWAKGRFYLFMPHSWRELRADGPPLQDGPGRGSGQPGGRGAGETAVAGNGQPPPCGP